MKKKRPEPPKLLRVADTPEQRKKNRAMKFTEYAKGMRGKSPRVLAS